MTTIAATFSRQMKRPAAGGVSYAKPGLIKRFRRFIEYSGWDEKLMDYERSADKICLGILIASGIYFLPVLLNIFLR